MIRKVVVPKIDANIEEATVGRWLLAEGATVRRRQPLVELITDKAVFELESPAAGLLRRIVAREKSVLPIGAILALLGEAADPLPDADAFNRRLVERARARAGTHAPAARGNDVGPSLANGLSRRTVRATPAARRVAREKGVDLTRVQATMGGEVVTEKNVRDFLDKG